MGIARLLLFLLMGRVPQCVSFQLLPWTSYFIPYANTLPLHMHVDASLVQHYHELFSVVQQAVVMWNGIPSNHLPFVLYTQGALTSAQEELAWGSTSELMTRIHFLNGRVPSKPFAFTNFTFDDTLSTLPVRAAAFVDVSIFQDIDTLFNVVLHELGHIQLIDHPGDVPYAYLLNSEMERPVMGQSGTIVSPSRLLSPQVKTTLFYDDVSAVMYRDLLVDLKYRSHSLYGGSYYSRGYPSDSVIVPTSFWVIGT